MLRIPATYLFVVPDGGQKFNESPHSVPERLGPRAHNLTKDSLNALCIVEAGTMHFSIEPVHWHFVIIPEPWYNLREVVIGNLKNV